MVSAEIATATIHMIVVNCGGGYRDDQLSSRSYCRPCSYLAAVAHRGSREQTKSQLRP